MQGASRIAANGRTPPAGYVDLGSEPPLSVGAPISHNEQPIHRAVSLRWLSGSILTGLTSTFLMGGALLAALDGGPSLSMPAAPAALADLGSRPVTYGRKGDRMRPVEIPVSSRQVVQVSTISREDDRDVIKLRPFVRIRATLATGGEMADRVPPYDPLAIMGDGSAPAEPAPTDQIYGADVDGEVVVRMSPFPLDAAQGPAREVTTAEIEEIVRDSARLISGDGVQLAALPFADPGRFSFDEPADDPFAALGVRIIPENVSYISKGGAGAFEAELDERVVAPEDDETLPALLARNEVGEEDVQGIVARMGELLDLGELTERERVRIAFAPADADGGTLRPLRVSIYDDGVHQATVARTDEDEFVRADEPAALDDATALAETRTQEGQMPRLYEAVYQTALEQGVPEPLITELVRVFAYDVDFQSRISPGDGMELFHPQADEDGAEQEGILFASLTLGNQTRRFYRYQTPDDGVVDFYDEEGRSAKKFLLRKPMTTGTYRSGFGMRRHPILGYRRLHTGVDWAAPSGTPIMAAGDGVVVRAEWSSGYGRYTVVRHNNGYESAYAHQSAFASGIAEGVRVRQGQVIGYVGSTGLSTGPHLHYEVRINGTLVDPLRIRLPRGRVLTGDMLAEFQAERRRIDALLGNNADRTRLAHNQ